MRMTYFAFGYPIAVEWENETHAFGVVVPDLPGCFSAGDTLDDAIFNIKGAVALWIQTESDHGRAIPSPSKLTEAIKNHPEYADWEWGIIGINPYGIIRCAYCGEWTPVEEIGIDHLCDKCLLQNQSSPG